MRLAIRNNLTNELTAIILEDLPEGLTDKEIQEWINDAPGLDETMLQFLEEENMSICYEEETEPWMSY